MNAILDWLKHPLWGGPAAYLWILGALALLLNEWVSRSKSVRANSIAAVIPFVLQTLLVRVGLLRLPAGPLIVRFLEALSGVDIDGDGRIAGKTPPKGVPTVALLAALAMGATSCAHVQPVVDDFADCAGPEMEKICAELRPRIIDALSCSGLNTAMLPACAVAELAELTAKYGRKVGLCAVVAIRDAFSVPGVDGERLANLRARAREYVERENRAGLKLKGGA